MGAFQRRYKTHKRISRVIKDNKKEHREMFFFCGKTKKATITVAFGKFQVMKYYVHHANSVQNC